MKALITGASSGIGLDMARYLAKQKYELILVGRDREKLEKVQESLPTKVTIIVADLANEQKVKELYVLTSKENIDILINNAGFGDFGYFTETDLSKELDMINTNIKAVHILTKSFLKDMEKKNSGYILNVASSSAFQPGPLMSTYYASKSYVYNLTCAIYEELKKEKAILETQLTELKTQVSTLEKRIETKNTELDNISSNQQNQFDSFLMNSSIHVCYIHESRILHQFS